MSFYFNIAIFQMIKPDKTLQDEKVTTIKLRKQHDTDSDSSMTNIYIKTGSKPGYKF